MSIEVDPLTAFVDVDVSGDVVEVEVVGQGEKGDPGGGAFDGDASDVPYTPATEGDWDPVPAQVAEALDELAARESGGAASVGGDWVVQAGDGSGGFKATALKIDGDANSATLGSSDTPVTATLRGDWYAAGNGAEWWSAGFVKQLFRFSAADGRFFFGEGTDENDGVLIQRDGGAGDGSKFIGLAANNGDGDVGLVVSGTGQLGLLRDDGTVDWQASGEVLGTDGGGLPIWTTPSGGGADLSDATPADLGTAAAGTSPDASRADHVHDMPTAADVGALASGSGYNTANGWLKLDGSGTAPDSTLPSSIARDTEVTSAVSAHAAATDPHGDRAYADGKVAIASGLVVVDCGTDLTVSRPAGAASVLWRFDAGVDPGIYGENIVNGQLGDLWFVED